MVKSYLNGINELIGGEFREKEFYSVYGEPSVGKSLYLMGEVVNLINNGVRVIWIDTEGGFEGLWSEFSPRLFKRFGFDATKLNDFFTYKRFVTAEEFCSYMGFKLSVNYEKKVSIDIDGWKEKDSELYSEFGRMRGKIALIVDSFTAPSKIQIPTSIQNFSARADLESFMILSLMKFMERTKAFTIMTSHESKNPTDIYHSNPVMRGGNTVKYFSKYILYFEKPKKKLLTDFRKITGARTPVGKDWSKMIWSSVKDDGYYDATEEGVQNVLNGGVVSDE